jgi:hypothetical protein
MIYLIALAWILALIYLPPFRRFMIGLFGLALLALALYVSGDHDLAGRTLLITFAGCGALYYAFASGARR